ncbi:MAG: DNA topoisomerase IB [Alphaproteobacteria bacterium]|nr:DNA topoisomerase IB [Alphaproteobacteria bacterium]
MEDLKAAGLSYVSDHGPGIRRRRFGAGFSYRNPDGTALTDEAALDRIRKLAIPPAWTDVWICPDPRGHIQATGRDQKGRKQYRYHSRWRQVRDDNKYHRVIDFGRALPRLRARVDKDLKQAGLHRDKVLAAVVRLMEITLIRVGNEEYAKQNKSFGLTTFRNRHARVRGSEAVFEFRGKSGKAHRTGIRDRRLARIIKACQELPGQHLFEYIDDDGALRTVESADVNDYLRDAMGEDFSAKDFRTWAGTVNAARALAMAPECGSATEAKRHISTCVKAVAGLLGNTAAVCRSAYIHPVVLTAYEEGALPFKGSTEGRAFELAVLRFLEEAHAAATEAEGPGPKGASVRRPHGRDAGVHAA